MPQVKLPAIFIVLASLLGAGAPRAAPLATSGPDIENLVAQLETAEQGRDARLDQQTLAGRLFEAKTMMEQRLRDLPRHVPTLILAARLERFLLLSEIGSTPGDRLPDAHVLVEPVLEKLNHAAEIEPRNADIYFWEARTWAMRLPARRAGRVIYAPVDLNRAINAAGTAVDLAPGDDRFREALALLLVENRQAPRALSVMQDATDKRHPVYLLLGDFINIPVPANAVYSPAHSERLALMQLMRGRYKDYPQLRVRYYLVPASVSELERGYREYWQGFHFIRRSVPGDAVATRDGGEVRLYTQYLSYQQGVWRPAIEESDVPKSPESGILLSVMEMRNPPEAMREKSLAGFSGIGTAETAPPASPPPGEVYSFLIIVNYRAAK